MAESTGCGMFAVSRCTSDFSDDAQFATLWASAKRVYLVSPSDERRAYLAKLGPVLNLRMQAENLCSPTGRAGCAKGKSGKPVRLRLFHSSNHKF